MGFTAEHRTAIFACRPAPIQVNYLGFAGTMSAPYIDYLIADSIVTPDDKADHYAERIMRLPGSYVPWDASRCITQTPPSRDAVGLPEDAFVFACFNNSYKLSPEVFDVWMRLLSKVEGSVLWLSNLNQAAVRNLSREAKTRDVDGKRLIFAPFVAKPEDHLARLQCADLFLDTLPYNAHTTAADALAAGLPVVTCLGGTFAGRVAASLLHAAGLPELMTNTISGYEDLALALARDRNHLAGLRSKLIANRVTEPLFDTARYTRNLEAVFLQIFDRGPIG